MIRAIWQFDDELQLDSQILIDISRMLTSRDLLAAQQVCPSLCPSLHHCLAPR